jgi:hypothetical protein
MTTLEIKDQDLLDQPRGYPFRKWGEDGVVKVFPHPGQIKVFLSTNQIVALQCGSGFGKTVLGPHWLHAEMQKRGWGDYLAVTASYPLLDNAMLPELRYVFEELLNWGEWKASSRIFNSHEHHHGAPASRIIVGSAVNPDSLEAATAKAAWLDEAGQDSFSRGAWEAIQRRLNRHRGRILITTTPYEWNWYKAEIYDRWVQGDPYIQVIQGDSIDNPTYSVEAYERAREILPRWKFNMFHRGIFEKPAGLIYDTFDSDTCIVSRTWEKPPANYRCYVGHDFGPNNTAAVWFAQDPDTGYMWIYRTYHAGGLSHFDHAQKWKALSEGENIVKRVGGALAEDGQREACAAAGWPISKPKERSVEAGIMAVYGWMQSSQIFIFKDLVNLIDELQSYSYALNDDYTVKQPTTIKDKSSFHQMDCIRYALSDFPKEKVAGADKARVIYHGSVR